MLYALAMVFGGSLICLLVGASEGKKGITISKFLSICKYFADALTVQRTKIRSMYNVQCTMYNVHLGGDTGGFQKAVGHLCGGMGWH